MGVGDTNTTITYLFTLPPLPNHLLHEMLTEDQLFPSPPLCSEPDPLIHNWMRE